MRFFNLGKKDPYGKQKRIEHRGKHLRVSRTGGAALRAQTKVAGLNVTANSKHGLRVSSRIAKNTQIALQNGRPVLRGRYGRGATKVNLSKSGVSLSTRNPMGTFNWVKPNRSSVKIAGVQLRGKKAANIQLIYMVIAGAALGLRASWQGLSFVLRMVAGLLSGLFRLILQTPYLFGSVRQRIRSVRINSRLKHTEQLFNPAIDNWTEVELQTALLLVLTGWGRGITAEEAAVRIVQHQQQQAATAPQLTFSASTLHKVAQRLEHIRSQHQDQTIANPQAITALLAQQHIQTLTAEDTVESLLNADEWVVALDQRTVLQEQLLQVFADFAQLRLQLAAPEQQDSSQTANQQDDAVHLQATPAPATYRQASVQNLINLNTASHAQLQTLPHIGFDRALDIMAMRPISHVSQLTDINGIGPARLADIEQAGVEL